MPLFTTQKPSTPCSRPLRRSSTRARRGTHDATSSSLSPGARGPRRSYHHRVIDLAAASPVARSDLGEMVKGGGGGGRGEGEGDPVQDYHAVDSRRPTPATSTTPPPQGRPTPSSCCLEARRPPPRLSDFPCCRKNSSSDSGAASLL